MNSAIGVSKFNSCIVLFGFDDTIKSEIRVVLDQMALQTVVIKDYTTADETFEAESHILGVFYKSENKDEISEIVTLSKQLNIPLTVFSDTVLENAKECTLASNVSLSSCLPQFFSKLLPIKIRELCLFSIKSIIPSLIPDLNLNLVEVGSETIAFDSQVKCETLAKNFLGAITIKAHGDTLKTNCASLQSVPEEEIMDFLSEIANQTLGIVNQNLRRINIDARIGLPKTNSPDAKSEYNVKSNFFLASCNFEDKSKGLYFTFQFLYPFLMGSTISHNFDFQLGAAKEDDGIDFF